MCTSGPAVFPYHFSRCAPCSSDCYDSWRATLFALAADVADGFAVVRIANNALKGDVEIGMALLAKAAVCRLCDVLAGKSRYSFYDLEMIVR